MLRELQTFIAVARHGTFAGAGAHIGLTQSAVSAQMQRLEAHLGVTLFDRTGRSATLNKAGRRTLELADKLRAAGTRFIIEPHVRFKGEVGEQATMFFLDPSGNALEFKAFRDRSLLFAK